MNKTSLLSQKPSRSAITFNVVPELETMVEWSVTMNADADPLYSFRLGVPKKERRFRVADAYEVRDNFLWIRSPQDAFAVFEKYGPPQIDPTTNRAAEIRFSALMKRRELFSEFLLEAPEAAPAKFGIRKLFESLYLSSAVNVEVSPFHSDCRVRCSDVFDATRVAIVLGRRQNVTVKICARARCGREFVFSNRNGKPRRFCSKQCEHAENVRISRERN